VATGCIALAAVATACLRPPSHPVDDQLVDVATVDPTIRIDMRYATPDNFTGVAVYPVARCLLRRDAADRLARLQRRLRTDGLGLVVWDCYRPFSVQERFWALVPDERYVARPERRDGRPVAGSKHNRGDAVDVTLADATGARLEMPTGFDDFSDRAHRDATPGSPPPPPKAPPPPAATVSRGLRPPPPE